MRKYLLLMGFVCMGLAGNAQTNSNEAKAAYLLAEECYGKGDYKCAIDYLQQVRESLGSANCKILYLQIMATRELYAKDPNMPEKVLPLIAEFEKSPDYATFNEEKTLEVSKIKLVIKSEQKAKIEKEKAEEIIKGEAIEKYYDQLLHSAGGFGITMDELDKSKPAWKVKDWKKKDIQNIQLYYNAYLFSPEEEDYPFIARRRQIITANAISGILVSDDKIIGYIVQILDFDESKPIQSMAYDLMKNSVNSFMDSYTKSLGPNYRTDHFKAMGNTATVNDWRKGDCGIKMASVAFSKGKAGVAKLIEILYCDPAKKLEALTK